MWIFKFIYYKWNERRRLHILSKFNDYEKFIEEQQKAVSKIKDETFKISAILNLYIGHYLNNQLDKAEEILETMKSFDIDDLDDSIKYIYFYYSINHYIATGNEIMVDRIWEESQSLREEVKEKCTEIYRHTRMNYNNFKGLYEESNKVLLEDGHDKKDDVFCNILKAEIYFNVGKEEEAKFIINDLLNGDKKLTPIVKKKIKELQAQYMNVEYEGFINTNETDEKISFKDKVWLKVRDSAFMRNLLFLFIDIKNILKNKYILLIFGPIVAAYLWGKLGYIALRDNTYRNYWNHVMGSIFLGVLTINITLLFINYMIKSKKYFSTILVALIILSPMSFIFFGEPYSSTLMATIKDLPYVVSKGYVEEVTTIEYIDIVSKSDYEYIEIEISNNSFELFYDDKFYNYILQNCYEGDIVKIKYLPNTKDLIYIKLEDITK
ncbi:hypothetical protein KQI86_08255 [Clostridium sp. MSJ-11]|uniref:Uncharacterized protein n=1 Tax=Clostridium mobile TaxID=2841512 RepID=A0ABS6EH34_9CLOT|nr:hypothetical protein [Clostridium mobile]MBU5484318.1 hypothetical protein [Clostridium mobile]